MNIVQDTPRRKTYAGFPLMLSPQNCALGLKPPLIFPTVLPPKLCPFQTAR